ncbi:T9SS type A sorting domain-containing protein [Bacteroidota bacterium]
MSLLLGGGFSIGDNPVLTSLSGLENLTSIPGLLYIWDCSSLVSLAGLVNVTSMGGDLAIVDNDALTSLMGLDNIDAASIDSLRIYHNNSLSTCEVKSICDFLASPTGTIEIYDNATGCNSQQEVEDACEVVQVENISFEEKLSIYPNPANRELFISISNGAILTEVNIYNQIGQKVLHQKPITQPIDVSMLRPGVYINEVCSQNFKVRKKLIIR